jgi:hypothetical protein
MAKSITLKATFLYRTYSKSNFGKLISSRKSENSYMYYGKTKKECIDQARERFRSGVYWDYEFSTELINN